MVFGVIPFLIPCWVPATKHIYFETLPSAIDNPESQQNSPRDDAQAQAFPEKEVEAKEEHWGGKKGRVRVENGPKK